MEAVNRKLKEMFPIVYGEPDYSNYYELRERLEQGTMGLRGAEQPADRTDRNQGSVNSSLKEMAQLFSEYMDIQTAAENGASRVELERSVSAFEEKLRQKQEELLQRGRLRGSVAGPAPERAADIRKPTICGWLEEESKEELKERADELSLIHIKSLKKKELAEKIANEMLRPSVMKKRMAFLSDEEIRAFETAIEKGGYYPDREELTLLEPLYDLLYVLIYADDYVAVPQEAAQAYQRINTPEFQRVRQENCWMSRCLDVTGMLYRVASVRVACRLLSVCIGREIRGKEFKSIYHSMPEEKRTCVLQDGLLIDETIFRRDTWQTYQNAQADVPFYIPKKEEIQEYSTYGYPDSDDRYRGLKEFLQ